MDLTANFSGWTELGQALATLPDKMQKQIEGEALQSGADIVYTGVVRNIPRGKPRANAPHPSPYMSLALREGKPSKGKGGSKIGIDFDTKRFPKLITTSKKGDRAFYPAVVEYGSKHVAAQAPMRKGFDATKQPAVDAIFAKTTELVTQHMRANTKQ